MGGMGSGRRWRIDAKNTTEGRQKIDIRDWNRRGLLTFAQSFYWQWSRNSQRSSAITVHVQSGQVIFEYSRQDSNGFQENKKYPIAIAWSPCTYGGERPWFICPAKGCQRRVAILYSGSIYACRQCHALAYKSQNESDYDRPARRAEKIRGRLGWNPGIFEMMGDKPKGMHWSTFERLSALQNELIIKSLTKADMRFGSNFIGEYLFE